MEMRWTPEQQKVIETRNANVLVSAAAGSGKTAVLVARILSMITDLEHPVSIDELLIVTFTRAAAGANPTCDRSSNRGRREAGEQSEKRSDVRASKKAEYPASSCADYND